GVRGAVSAANSLVGVLANSGLQATIVADNANYTFITRFLYEGGGRVRVGSQDVLQIASLVDIPNDQGGWLRLTFNRFGLDVANSSPALASYGVWRRVPGTIPARLDGTSLGQKADARMDTPMSRRMRTGILAGLEVREVDGRFFVTVPGGEGAGMAT